LHALQPLKRPAAGGAPLTLIINLVFVDGHILIAAWFNGSRFNVSRLRKSKTPRLKTRAFHFALDSDLYPWKLSAFLLADKQHILT